MFQILLTFLLLRFGLDKYMQRYPTPSRRLQQPMKVSAPSSSPPLRSSPLLTDKPPSSDAGGRSGLA